MNLLLDTHTFVWWRDDPEKLSAKAFELISDPDNEVYLSVVSAWELQIKIALNKVELKESLRSSIEEEQQTNGFLLLPVTLPHVLHLEHLPSHHKDPFDRLLISQAAVENMHLVSGDARFTDYSISLLW
jgi:PIN domain nuclease of toxin-antitoxin system